MNDAEKTKKINKAANDIMVLARNTLIANLRFLDIALCQFKFIPSEVDTFATEGEHVYFNPVWIIKRYMDEKDVFMRDYLHMVFHCIFKHMFIGKNVNHDYWNLACDMAVEFSITELNIAAVKTKRELAQQETYESLKANLKLLTVEKIYKYLIETNLSSQELAHLHELFYVDNHMLWFDPNDQEEDEKPKDQSNQNSEDESSDETPEDNSTNKESNESNNQDGELQETDDEHENQLELEGDGTSPGSGDKRTGNAEATDEESNGNKSKGSDTNNSSEGSHQYQGENSGTGDLNSTGDNLPEIPTPKEELAEKWQDIAKRVEVDLETFSKSVGDEAQAFSQNVKEVNREKYDYTAFLRKFARLGETLKLNEDEFDYIYYTYGLQLYKKVPLIEPLEYKDVNKIKEFVIAIDTSGSVSGEVAQTFVKKTYNILKSTESFFSRINLHIIQCDAQIQEDVKITNQVEFDNYISNMKLLGLGGTDFRPVFTYVDQLIKDKEFTHLKGLIYFTDGWGEFPKKKPNYDVAFVYIEDDYTNPDVPPWAMKVVLQSDEI